MFKASWKSLLARKASLVLSILAIVLGTAFVAGSFTFTDMLGNAFNGIMNGAVADVNVQPKGADDSMGAVEKSLNADVVDKVRAVDGVASAYGMITVNDTYLLDKNGKVMTLGAPGIGGNYIDAPAFGGQPGLRQVEGRAPKGADEVVIDPQALTKSGYKIGDKIKVVTSGSQNIVEPTIVGTVLYGAKNSTGGATYAIFDTPTAQKLYMEGKNTYMGVWVTAKPGVDVVQLADRVGKVAPAGFEAKTGKEVAEKVNGAIASGLGFFNNFLLFFAGVALLVGSFIIVNTFSILVAQRGRELALFRAMGSSRAQVTRSVLVEAVLLGLIGSTGGLLLGFAIAFGIQVMFAAVGMDLSGAGMRLTPQALLWTYAVGLLVTIVAAAFPAIRAGRVPPVAAMSGDVMTGKSGLGWRAVGGGLMIAFGMVALLTGLFMDTLDNRLWYVTTGASNFLLGVAAVSPILGRPVVWLLGRLNQAVFGQVGRLAEVNALRNPRRTAVTASALMIGLTLVTAVGMLASSMKASTDEAIGKAMRTDFVVQNAAQQPFSPAIGDKMAQVDGVQAVYRLRFVPAKLNDKQAYLGAMDPASFGKLIKQTMVQGSLEDFRADTLLLHEDKAKQDNVKVGDTLRGFINGQDVPLKVVGIFSTEKGTGIGSELTTIDTLSALGMRSTDSFLAVDAAPGADKAKVRAGLDAVVKEMPLVAVADKQEYASAQAQSIDQLLVILYGLLGLAIVIAILGIINTLALSIVERTRELGLLRAVGLNRPQVRRMIVLESVTIALLGCGLGIGLGLLFGWALQRSMADGGLTILVLPWAQIAVSFVVALLVGVLAGLWPAVKATKIDVLKAITTA